MSSETNQVQDSAGTDCSLKWANIPNDVGWHWKATRHGDEGDVDCIYVDHVALKCYRSHGDMRGRGTQIMYLGPFESPENPLFK